ncbi:serine--tRNA ligase, mitochondrial-like [Plakobranchus ocellatus]|uniref:serine--tRNA ligase n=1 Tax=Plakobranchus ocellatus TaxID=259542 RepID=A0AAV3XUT8_9GAST|nr:serine--tRNA ligase, mitochondrial-like [Plakobranchus ocellatus]
MLKALLQLEQRLCTLLRCRQILQSKFLNQIRIRDRECPSRQLHIYCRHWKNHNAKHCNQSLCEEWNTTFQIHEPELDWEYLLDKRNRNIIAENITQRKGVGDIDKVLMLADDLMAENDITKRKFIRENLITEALQIPNFSHPNTPVGDEAQAKEIGIIGCKRDFDFKPRMVREIAGRGLRMFRDENLTFATGSKTYFLEDGLARLEQALVAYTVERLMLKGFELVSVPDLLQCEVVDGCGFKTSTNRSQVYRLHPKVFTDVCLSGTAEMALAGYFMNDIISHEELPKKIMAVSRCYRAEAAEKAIERGLYRVHHFTKVEAFGVTASEKGTESDELLEEILSIEKELFDELGLYFRILEMPTQELGAPAHRKYDIEAWMHGKNIWGEISSCSNCTDYQSRRLNIKYTDPSGVQKHAHTVNGTGCAVPRMIISILEQNQQQGRKVKLPEVLWPYMDKDTHLTGEGKAKAWFTFVKTLRRI